MTSNILYSAQAGVALLTLNRPDAYNALSSELMRELIQQLDSIDTDPSIKVVVIRGSGRGFCAGHDLQEIDGLNDHAAREKLFALCSNLMLRVQSLRQPVIASVHGVATAAGCQLVATCDLGLAAESARFATPGVNIGLFCSTPMVALTRAVQPKHAMQMLLSGEMIGAARACEIGLINTSVADERLEDATAELAAGIAEKSAAVLAIGKEAFYRQAQLNTQDA